MLFWEAIYKDGTSLRQFNGEKENLFGDINQEKLIVFKLGNVLSVDLRTGVFTVNGLEFRVDGLSFREENYRLIFFRRKQYQISKDPQTKRFENTEYFIGFQITIDGVNHKTMISLNGDMLTFHKK